MSLVYTRHYHITDACVLIPVDNPLVTTYQQLFWYDYFILSEATFIVFKRFCVSVNTWIKAHCRPSHRPFFLPAYPTYFQSLNFLNQIWRNGSLGLMKHSFYFNILPHHLATNKTEIWYKFRATASFCIIWQSLLDWWFYRLAIFLVAPADVGSTNPLGHSTVRNVSTAKLILSSPSKQNRSSKFFSTWGKQYLDIQKIILGTEVHRVITNLWIVGLTFNKYTNIWFCNKESWNYL